MRIALIGPGIMSIPPTGWGAVESLVWDYHQTLLTLGHDSLIVNTPDHSEIIRQVNAFFPDVVHLHYDDHISVMRHIQCPIKLATSHYGYLTQKHRYDANYSRIHNDFLTSDCILCCLSQEILQQYKAEGMPEQRLLFTPNGADDSLFRYSDKPVFPSRSIYLAQINDRKRQSVYADFPSLYFAGRRSDSSFPIRNFLGEWTKAQVYSQLTDYGNLVLLSDGEAAPLVVPEALISGLGVVVSEFAAANIPRDKDWITVVPTADLFDKAKVQTYIDNNRKASIQSREDIRAFGLQHFSWTSIIKNYLQNVKDMK